MPSAIEVGRVVVKTVGREAGSIGVIVEVLDYPYVTLDGQVKRRRCNLNHLEPTQHHLAIKKSASHEDVVHELKKFNIEVKAHQPHQTPARQEPKRVLEAKQKPQPEKEKSVEKPKAPEHKPKASEKPQKEEKKPAPKKSSKR